MELRHERVWAACFFSSLTRETVDAIIRLCYSISRIYSPTKGMRMNMSEAPVRIVLSEKEIPRQWYDIRYDMPNKPAPYLNPHTLQPVTFNEMCKLFSEEVVRQEMSMDQPFVDIPEEVLDYYKMFRPTPVIRARKLEKALGTPAHIYFKHEGENASNSHKLNTLIPQVYYAKKQGLTGIVTETGAGNAGSRFSFGGKMDRMRTSFNNGS